LSHHVMDRGLCLELLDFLLPFGYQVNVYIDDKLYVEENSPEAELYRSRNRIYLHVVPCLRELMAGSATSATKIVAIAGREQISEVMAQANARFNGGAADRIQAMPSRPTFLEFGRPDMGKGVALAAMAAEYGLEPEQVMAIGDSPNDLDMIEYAGWSVAMANGEECVKEAARWITASNEEDGVAIAIESFVLGGL